MPATASRSQPDAAAVDGRAPRSARRPGVEARLIDAVAHLVEGGTPFASLSIAELVAEAGIGRATFYLYFPDRTAFLVRLVDHAREQIAEPLAVFWNDSGAERDVLESVIRTIVARFHAHGAVISTVIEAAAVDAAVATRLDEHMDEFIRFSAAALEHARRSGQTRSDLRVQHTATALGWMIERVCYKLVREADPAELDAIADSLSAIVWHTLHGDASVRCG
jgi:AcrR family transcriptional regulator